MSGWGRALATFERYQEFVEVQELDAGTLRECSLGLKAPPSVEGRIERQRRLYLRGEIDLREFEIRVGELLEGSSEKQLPGRRISE